MEGQVFGNLTVISRTANSRTGAKRYLCRCDCGCNTEREVFGWALRSGSPTSCGLRARGPKPRGEDSPLWKGGRHTTKKGYVMLHITDARPKAKYEHIEIMEGILGRSLIKGETVHHKNGIRNDNSPSNLELRVSNHPPGQSINDVVEWATELLRRYAPKRLQDN